MTKQRTQTFFDGNANVVKHVRMEDPFCNNLRKLFKINSKTHGINFSRDSVYLCTEGPRFETNAEIKMMKIMGADVVGMTSVPEVVLAKELGICYASIGFIVNMGTGIENSMFKDHEIENVLNKHKKKLKLN